jgi:hypothetical protein
MLDRLAEVQSHADRREQLPTIQARVAEMRSSLLTTTGPSQEAYVDAFEPREYAAWDSHPLPGAAGAAQEEIIEALIGIVAVEGPIKCERLYKLYVEASGDPGVASVKKHLNSATYAAVNKGRLWQVEQVGGGQMNKTVYLPNTEPVVVRFRGPREVHEIPPSEVEALANAILNDMSTWTADFGPYEALDVMTDIYEVEPDTWESEYVADSSGLLENDDDEDEGE